MVHDTLAREDGLSNLLCLSCKRRLDNFSKFRKMVCEVQTALICRKRYIEVYPSATIGSFKSLRENSRGNVASRHSLSFDSRDSQLKANTDSSIQLKNTLLCKYEHNYLRKDVLICMHGTDITQMKEMRTERK
jgi:hypothetical protein